MLVRPISQAVIQGNVESVETAACRTLSTCYSTSRDRTRDSTIPTALHSIGCLLALAPELVRWSVRCTPLRFGDNRSGRLRYDALPSTFYVRDGQDRRHRSTSSTAMRPSGAPASDEELLSLQLVYSVTCSARSVASLFHPAARSGPSGFISCRNVGASSGPKRRCKSKGSRGTGTSGRHALGERLSEATERTSHCSRVPGSASFQTDQAWTGDCSHSRWFRRKDCRVECARHSVARERCTSLRQYASRIVIPAASSVVDEVRLPTDPPFARRKWKVVTVSPAPSRGGGPTFVTVACKHRRRACAFAVPSEPSG